MPHEKYRDPSPYLLQGQVGLVTGAGSAYGIGRSLVKKLAQAGAAVIYACDLNTANFASLEEEVKKINLNATVVGQLLDVSSEEQTNEVLKTMLNKYGRFDFFFANAGFAKVRDINEIQLSHFELCHKVMSTSIFLAIKYGGRAMMVTSKAKPEAAGSIVVTASIAASNPAFGDIAYSAAKRAAVGLVKSGAVNLSASNIRVNGISPGVTQTAIFANSEHAENTKEFSVAASETEMKESYRAFVATKNIDLSVKPKYYYHRISQPDDIADIGIFLVSDLSLAINGHVIDADSGAAECGLAENYLGPVPSLVPLDF